MELDALDSLAFSPFHGSPVLELELGKSLLALRESCVKDFAAAWKSVDWQQCPPTVRAELIRRMVHSETMEPEIESQLFAKSPALHNWWKIGTRIVRTDTLLSTGISEKHREQRIEAQRDFQEKHGAPFEVLVLLDKSLRRKEKGRPPTNRLFAFKALDYQLSHHKRNWGSLPRRVSYGGSANSLRVQVMALEKELSELGLNIKL